MCSFFKAFPPGVCLSDQSLYAIALRYVTLCVLDSEHTKSTHLNIRSSAKGIPTCLHSVCCESCAHSHTILHFTLERKIIFNSKCSVVFPKNISFFGGVGGLEAHREVRIHFFFKVWP